MYSSNKYTQLTKEVESSVSDSARSDKSTCEQVGCVPPACSPCVEGGLPLGGEGVGIPAHDIVARQTSAVNRMTDRYKKLSYLPATSFAGGKNSNVCIGNSLEFIYGGTFSLVVADCPLLTFNIFEVPN